MTLALALHLRRARRKPAPARHRLRGHLPPARLDALTPVEEVQDTLNTFVREGKVRYIACSNFPMAPDEVAGRGERYGWTRFVGIKSIIRSSAETTSGS